MNLHQNICEAIKQAGGRAYLVGGCVRDRLLGREATDIDCEVHGLTPEALCALLGEFGEVDKSGEAFGVYTLRAHGFDFALPRTETRTGDGHTDFAVTPMVHLTPEEAAARRDFTVNAIMMDALTGEIIDPYGGREDLARGVLRAVPGGQFCEDALRVLRGAQFCARFDFTPDKETLLMMRGMLTHRLSAQRVMEETRKALLGSDEPDKFLWVLHEANALGVWFKELKEENVYQLSMVMLRRAAALREEAENPEVFMLAALCGAIEEEEDAAALLERLGVGEGMIKQCLDVYRSFLSMEECVRMRRESAALLRLYAQDMPEQDLEYSFALAVMDHCQSPRDMTLLTMANTLDDEDMAFMKECLLRYEAAAARPMPTGQMFLDRGVEPGKRVGLLVSGARFNVLMGMELEDAIEAALNSGDFQ